MYRISFSTPDNIQAQNVITMMEMTPFLQKYLRRKYDHIFFYYAR